MITFNPFVSGAQTALWSSKTEEKKAPEAGFDQLLSSAKFTPAVEETSASGMSLAEATQEEFDALFETETPADIIKQIAGGGYEGYWSWQIEQMKEKLAQEVMQEQGLTSDKLDAMSEEDRMAAQQDVIDLVQQRLEEWVKSLLREDMSNNQANLSQASGVRNMAEVRSPGDTMLAMLSF